jgi:hypothetical protein
MALEILLVFSQSFRIFAAFLFFFFFAELLLSLLCHFLIAVIPVIYSPFPIVTHFVLVFSAIDFATGYIPS